MSKNDAQETANWSNLAIITAVTAVSFSAIFIRWSNAHPLVIAFYRMGITSLILLPVVLFWYWKDIKQINRNELLIMIAIGVVLALHFGTWITSLRETSVASSVILVTSHPLFVAIVAHYLFREKLRAIGYIGMIIAFSGIVILSLGDYGLSESNFRGDMLALIGAVAAGTYILGGRKLRKTVSLAPYAFIVYSVCSLTLLPVCLLFSAKLHPLPLREYELFLLMAIVPTILGHTLFNYALKYVKAQIISVSILGEPIGSTILAFALLSEAPPVFTIIGGALILPGIYLTYSARKTREGEQEEEKK